MELQRDVDPQVFSSRHLECTGVAAGLWVLAQLILDFLIQSKDAVKWKPSISPGVKTVQLFQLLRPLGALIFL